MGSKMIGNRNIDELVKYQGQLYLVVKIICFDWNYPEDSLCYGLVSIDNIPNQWPLEMVAAVDVETPTSNEIAAWRVLHGEKNIGNPYRGAKSKD